MYLENNEQQKKGLITPCIAHPVNSIIEVVLGLSKAFKAASVHSDMIPKKVPETQNTINLINPETSSIPTSNNIPEIIPRTLGKKQEIPKKIWLQPLRYNANQPELDKKHLQHKLEKKLKKTNYHQIPLWDSSQLCYLCKHLDPTV